MEASFYGILCVLDVVITHSLWTWILTDCSASGRPVIDRCGIKTVPICPNVY